jgi:cbb3-type cytochrome oxidase subunit 3
MLEALTGIGLSASAGLNAWIPLLMIGVLNRFTNLITLPHSWQWLSNGWILVILGILLAFEIVADKIPIVDSANDAVQTFVRPTAGGLAFGASSGAHTVTVSDPTSFFRGHEWIAVTSGALIALVMHVLKATARPIVNTVTIGAGAPVVSTAEDVTSTGLSIVSIVIPILVIFFLALIVYVLWRVRRRMRARRAARQQLQNQPKNQPNHPRSQLES